LPDLLWIRYCSGMLASHPSGPTRGLFRSAASSVGHLGLVALLLGACGDKNPAAQRIVLVTDTGIDASAPAFAGRLLGQYTIKCKALPGSGGPKPPRSFESEKAAALASFKMADETCWIEEGISPKPDPLADLASVRERWNRQIQNSEYVDGALSWSEYSEIFLRMDTVLRTTNMHGTSTAGLIARDNPNVQLVLLERELGDKTQVSKSFACFRQSDLDLTTQVLSDKDVIAAYVARPKSRLERDLDALVARYGVELINESFGPLPRQALEELQKQANCAPVDLQAYFAATAKLLAKGEWAKPLAPTLKVRAAGNDAAVLMNNRDSYDCFVGNPLPLTVGSYGLTGARSAFTNSGNCVDLYAPGEWVIAPVLGGWLVPQNGTSFSAPLVVSLLSNDVTAFDAIASRDRALARGDAAKRLPRSEFPPKIVYDPKHLAESYSIQAARKPMSIDVQAWYETLQFLDFSTGQHLSP